MKFISQVPIALRGLADKLDGSDVVRAIIITERASGKVEIIVQGEKATLFHNMGALLAGALELKNTLTGP